MSQENKNLLLQDLCLRLPHTVKIFKKDNEKICGHLVSISGNKAGIFSSGYAVFDIEQVAPYLYPLHNITKKQYDELYNLGYFENCSHTYKIPFKLISIETFSLPLLNWLLENHFDINNLIPKGLAIDATGLNIY